MYAGTNTGFIPRDAAEGSIAGVQQNYISRENGSNRPELVVTWG